MDVTDDDDQTPLHFASKRGNVAVVRCLLTKYGANLHAKDDDRNTPLRLACKKSTTGLRQRTDSVLEYLLQHYRDQLEEANDCISLAESTLNSRIDGKVFLDRDRKAASRKQLGREAWHQNEFAGIKPLRKKQDREDNYL